MITVGLTGGIGSGKSTVAEIWQERGACIIKADDLAKELMISDKTLIEEIKKTFGEDSYLPDGNLNRPYLAEVAFKKGRVAELNALVHPAVYREFEVLKQKELKKGTLVFVREAALLLDKGRPDGFDCIVVVTAPDLQRIKRVEKRDNADKESILQRMEKQLSQEKMCTLADRIIENNGDLSELKTKANHLFDEFLTWDQHAN